MIARVMATTVAAAERFVASPSTPLIPPPPQHSIHEHVHGHVHVHEHVSCNVYIRGCEVELKGNRRAPAPRTARSRCAENMDVGLQFSEPLHVTSPRVQFSCIRAGAIKEFRLSVVIPCGCLKKYLSPL